MIPLLLLLFFSCSAGGAPVMTTVIPLEGDDVSLTAAHHEAHAALRDSLIYAGTGYGGSQLFLCGRCPVSVHHDRKRYHLHTLELDPSDALHMLFCGGSALSPCSSNLTVHHDNVGAHMGTSPEDALAAHLLAVLNSKPLAPSVMNGTTKWIATPY